MSSKKPVVRQTAWPALVPQFSIMGVLAFVFTLFVKPFLLALCLAMTTYLAISLGLECFIPHNHRKGVLLCKQGNFAQAIEEFKKSYVFFCRHAWIDKYRYVTLLSSSKNSYTEMALINIGFCYVQCNNVKLAKEYYQKALELFPDSKTAKGALDMISSLEAKADGINK